MSEIKKTELDSLLKGEDDLADIDSNMDVDDILNEEDDFELPQSKKNLNNQIEKEFILKKEDPNVFLKTKSDDALVKIGLPNAHKENIRIMVNSESEFKLKTKNSEEMRSTPFGDSKIVFLYKINHLEGNL